MSYLLRQLYYYIYINSKPSHQTIFGIIFIPLGIIIFYWALYGDPTGYYPFFVVFGIVFSIVGILLTVKGIRGLTYKKTNVSIRQNTEQHIPHTIQTHEHVQQNQD